MNAAGTDAHTRGQAAEPVADEDVALRVRVASHEVRGERLEGDESTIEPALLLTLTTVVLAETAGHESVGLALLAVVRIASPLSHHLVHAFEARSRPPSRG
jgi:hypothetical protein